MSQVIQFRCAGCFKLLVKYDKSTDKVLYKAEGLYEQGDKEGNAMFLACPKCGLCNKITPKGLVEVNEDALYDKA